jgi:hypothetical protein
VIRNFPELKPNTSPGAAAIPFETGEWRLEIPPGPKGRYRLAQLDDYNRLPRRDFSWDPPFSLTLSARVSSSSISGTWGFGLWNDPFSLSLGLGGGTRRFPTLPNAAWFFFASPPNYLSLRDDLPAQGFLAQTFQSPSISASILALGSTGFPLLAWPWMARKFRTLLGRIIKEDSLDLSNDGTQWHAYTLEWRLDLVSFRVDGASVFETRVSPGGRLGLVVWIDNQYASFPPSGRLSYGSLSTLESAWLEIKSISIDH